MHTPGPWEISGGALRIVTKHEWVATVMGASPENALSPTDKTALSNARLIAAAPDLLEALKIALQTAEFEKHPFRSWHNQARAAIAKVGG